MEIEREREDSDNNNNNNNNNNILTCSLDITDCCAEYISASGYSSKNVVVLFSQGCVCVCVCVVSSALLSFALLCSPLLCDDRVYGTAVHGQLVNSRDPESGFIVLNSVRWTRCMH